MTPAFSARRRADEFEALVSRRLDRPEEPLEGRSGERYGELLTLVGELRAVPGPVPRADFAAALRERLMAEADTVLLPQAATSSASQQRDQQKLALPARSGNRRLAAVLGGAAMVGATATVAVAAQTALPGESLYPVKRGIEAAEHRLAPDDAARGRVLLASAERRLTELEALAAEEPTGSKTLIPDTLDVFSEQSEDGARTLLDAYGETGDSSAVDDLRAFTADSMDRLEAMEPSLPATARDELLVAGQRLADLDAAAAVACPVCDGGIADIPAFLITASTTRDLLAGLDSDDVQLDPAPVSGQDVTGLVVPEVLGVPTDQVTGAPGAVPNQSTGGKDVSGDVPSDVTGDVTGEVTGNVTGNGNGGKGGKGGGGTVPGEVGDEVEDVVDVVEDVVDGTTGTLDDVVTGTTDGVTGTLDEATGGAVGGLTEGVGDATDGLIGDVTGLPQSPLNLP